jgi:hypothetical protein
MNTFFWIIVPLILTALGFLTYTHALAARKILYGLTAIVILIGFFILTYWLTAINTFESSSDQIDKKLFKNYVTDMNIDSIAVIDPVLKSLNDSLKETGFIRSFAIVMEEQDIIKYHKALILQKEKEVQGRVADLFLGVGVAFGCFIILIGLTFFFQNLQHVKGVGSNNPPNNKTP